MQAYIQADTVHTYIHTGRQADRMRQPDIGSWAAIQTHTVIQSGLAGKHTGRHTYRQTTIQ